MQPRQDASWDASVLVHEAEQVGGAELDLHQSLRLQHAATSSWRAEHSTAQHSTAQQGCAADDLPTPQMLASRLHAEEKQSKKEKRRMLTQQVME